MKKLFFRLMLLLGVFAMSGCSSEKDSPIRYPEIDFDIKSLSDSNDYKVFLSSPDPCCLGYFYYIVANYSSSEVELTATNVESFVIDGKDLGINGVQIITGPDGQEMYKCDFGRWTIWVENNNTLRVTFDEVSGDDETKAESNRSVWVHVKATDGSNLYSTFEIMRYPEFLL